MKKTLKKFTAYFLATLMVFAAMPLTVFAQSEALSENSESDVVYNSFGNGLSWGFDETSGKLTIKGKGEMPDFAADEETIYKAYPNFDVYEYFGVSSNSTSSENSTNSTCLMKAKGVCNLGVLSASDEEEAELPFSPWKDLSGKIKSVVIDEGITYIGSYAFSFMFYLESVSFSKTVETIGEGAFYFDLKLENADFPESLKNIGEVAFAGCKLSALKFSKNIKSIGEAAFAMSAASSIEFEDDVENISEVAFEGDYFIKHLIIPEKADNISKAISCSAYLDLETVENKSSTYSFLDENISNLMYSSGENKGVYANYIYTYSMVDTVVSILGYSIGKIDENMTEEEIDEKLEEVEAVIIDLDLKLLGAKSLEDAEEKMDNALADIGKNSVAGLSGLKLTCNKNSAEHSAAKEYGIKHNIFNSDENCNCFNFSADVSETLSWKIDIENRTLYFEGEGGITLPYNEEEYCYENPAWYYLAGWYDTIDFSKAKITSIPSGAFSSSMAKEIIFSSCEINIAENIFNENYVVDTVIIKEDANSFDLDKIDIIPFKNLKVLNDKVILSGKISEDDITLYGGIGSTAEAYAKNNGLAFVYDLNGVEEANEDDFKTNWLSDSIKEYTGSSKIVRIPQEINGEKVTYIEAGAFDKTGVEYIILPEGMTRIPYQCFEGLTTLKGIFFSSTIKTIDARAFLGCTSLETVVFSKSLEKIGAYSFSGCSSLEIIEIPKSVKEISGGAFADCTSLKNFEIPSSILEIEEGTFSGCTSLTYVEIPETVSTIGGYVFKDCTALKSAKIGAAIIMGGYIFEGATALEEVILTTSVHEIIPNAFLGSEKLSLKVENANAQIWLDYTPVEDEEDFDIRLVEDDATIYGYTGSTAEDYAKKFNVNFVSIGTIDTVSKESNFEYTQNTDGTLTIKKYIGTSKNIEIPKVVNGKKVTKIGEEVFCCLAIESVVIPEGVTEIMAYAFDNCEKITKLSLPSTLKKLGTAAFTDIYLLDKLEIPNGVETIGDYAFSGFTSITELNIPESVISIGECAFGACFKLEKVTISKNVKHIDGRVFKYCYALEEISVDEENAYFSSLDGVLYNKDQSSLIFYPEGKKEKKHIVSENVESIGENAFMNNENIEEVVIPSNVSQIGEGAFESCTNLTSVIIENDSASEASAYSLFKARAKSGTIEINASAFKNCVNLERVVVPENVTYIGSAAFSGCSKLKKIIILNDECEIVSSVSQKDKTIPSGTTVHAFKNSTAEAYANENGLTFEEHKYEIEKVEKATCTSGEITTYACNGCGDFYTEKTSEANEHEIVIDKAVAATCTSTGLTQGEHCKNCDYKVEQEIVEPLGHLDSDSDGKCDYCGETVQNITCTHICHKTGIASVIYKILLFFWKILKINQYCECGMAHY